MYCLDLVENLQLSMEILFSTWDMKDIAEQQESLILLNLMQIYQVLIYLKKIYGQDGVQKLVSGDTLLLLKIQPDTVCTMMDINTE